MSAFLIFAFLFFIGSMVGWCIELVYRRFFSKNNPDRKWINPGFLTGPYLPLYGFGLWGMYAVSYICTDVLRNLSESKLGEAITVLVLMAIVMTVIEYIGGLIFIRGMHLKLWDYTHERLNIQGIICPKFSLMWGLLGCIYYFAISPYIMEGIGWLAKHLAFSFVIGLFFGVFLVDVCYSLQLSMKMRKFAKEKEITIKYEDLKAYLARRREELSLRHRFMLSFSTVEPFRNHLEEYFEKAHDKGVERIQELKENIKTRM